MPIDTAKERKKKGLTRAKSGKIVKVSSSKKKKKKGSSHNTGHKRIK